MFEAVHPDTDTTRLTYRYRARIDINSSSWEDDGDGEARMATLADIASRARHPHGRRATGQHLPHLQARQEWPGCV